MISKRTKIMAIVIVTMFLASGIATAYAYWLHINGSIKVTATDWWCRYEENGSWSQWYHMGNFVSNFEFNISNGQDKTYMFEIHNDDNEDRHLTVYMDCDNNISSKLCMSHWHNNSWLPKHLVDNGQTIYWYYYPGFWNNTKRFYYNISVPNTCDSGTYDVSLEFV